ncbi:MAG TPA: RNA-guided endonuclease IscB [Ktedonobacteraceae bacterium]|nr:RNA-guided endonuclease IscB [Ktedonobacteraceae bacterium]
MRNVFVVDTNKQPLNTIHPGEARLLLNRGKAAVLKRYPFTIILKVAIDDPVVAELRIKIDPGSKTTGIAIVNDQSGEVVFAAELTHRGQQIKSDLDDRRGVRRGRRNRHTRYRKPRWQNRRNKKKGWLAPSLASRINNVITWVQRLMRVCHIMAISMELVKFDTQLMENAEISGIEYQQGTLAEYEVREYLLQKWGHTCTYCGKENIPLQIEHIVPHAKLGSNRVSNLCLACEKCNTRKGTKDLKDFLKKKPDLLKKILAQAKAPLRDAAVVNATRKELFRGLASLGLPIECGSGGLTKYNRTTRELPKTHWLDAACIGKSTPEALLVDSVRPLSITAYGHGCRQMCLMNRYGFPRTDPKKKHPQHGFKTGDIVKAIVPSQLKRAGTHVGRMSAKASGSFTIATKSGTVPDVGKNYCWKLQRADGYGYSHRSV